MDDEIGVKYVDLFEESEMMSRPSSGSINNNDDLVGEFDASNCSGDIFYDSLRMRKNNY